VREGKRGDKEGGQRTRSFVRCRRLHFRSTADIHPGRNGRRGRGPLCGKSWERTARRGPSAITTVSRSDREGWTGAQSRLPARSRPHRTDPSARLPFPLRREGVDIILPARGVHPRGWRGRRRSRRRGRRRRRASRRWWQPGGENGERHSWRPSCAVSLWFRLLRCFLHCIPVCPRVRLQVLGFL